MNEIINELRDQLAKLTEDNRILQIKLDDAVSEIDEMEHKDGKMIASLVNTLKNYESMVLQSFDSGSAQMICNAEKLIGELTYERDELCDKLQSESDALSQKLRAAQHEAEALAAAVEALRGAYNELFQNGGTLYRFKEIFEENPRQHLRDVRAEAVASVNLDAYDAGYLNDFGGGNVSWWQDYIRSELGAAHGFYQHQIDQYAENLKGGKI